MANKEKIVYVLGVYKVFIRYRGDEEGGLGGEYEDTTDDIIRRYAGGEDDPTRLSGGFDDVSVVTYKNDKWKWSKQATLNKQKAQKKWWQFWKYFQKYQPRFIDDVVAEACVWIEEALGIDKVVQDKLRAVEEKVDSVKQDLVVREVVAKEILEIENPDSLASDDGKEEQRGAPQKEKQRDS